MSHFLLRRCLYLIPQLLVVAVVTFLLLHAVPGGPLAGVEGNPRIPRETVQRLRHLYGLDRPLPRQFAAWLGGVVHGDLGYSLLRGRPVAALIAERMPATLILMSSYLFVSLLLAIPLGVLAAVHRGGAADVLVSAASYVAQGTPPFYLALCLLSLFAVRWRLLPAFGDGAGGGPGEVARHLVLPLTSLTLLSVAGWSRYLRAQIQTELHADYVRTARAKGLSERVTLYRHALKNALLPMATLLGLQLPNLVGGAAMTEGVFAWPGLGSLAIGASMDQDYPLVLALVLMGVAATSFGNLLADLMYGFLDPRIRYS